MHRTRLRQILIDCTEETFEPNVEFWAAALGAELDRDADEPEYVELHGHGNELTVMLQRLGEGPSRVHLDIESDDVEAEVARLERLGATRVKQIRSWWVMRDPAGIVFCVIRGQPGFESATKTWDE